MSTGDLYQRFIQLEEQSKATYQGVAELREALSQVLEQNAELEIENKHLRTRLQELQKATTEADDKNSTQGLSKSKQNLQNLYEEGFHICPYFYGSRRDNDEPCAFCNDVIYGERLTDKD